MQYPHEILPNPNYKLIDVNLSAGYLIRHTNTQDISEIYNAETDTINVSHICQPSERINDLSSSLLGIFNEEHTKLEFSTEGKAAYMHYCDPDLQVDPPVFEKHYQINHNRHFWCIQIKHLHQIPFSIQRAGQTHQAVCLVTHSPMRWNYWHFSLRWLLDGKKLDEFDDKEKSKIARLIGHAALVTIAREATIHLPLILEIPKKFYIKASP